MENKFALPKDALVQRRNPFAEPMWESVGVTGLRVGDVLRHPLGKTDLLLCVTNAEQESKSGASVSFRALYLAKSLMGYSHHGVVVQVREELLGTHRQHCLCFAACKHFKPGTTGELRRGSGALPDLRGQQPGNTGV